MKRGTLAFVSLILLTPALTYTAIIEEIRPKAGATLSNTYIWDGRELKPKAEARLENTWMFNGKEIKPKSEATLKNTFAWNGSELIVVTHTATIFPLPVSL